MKSILRWEKGIFSKIYRIFDNAIEIGFIQDNIFSKSTKAKLNNKEFTFIPYGFIDKNTDIIDNQTNLVIGKIKYNNWMNKAEITVNGKTYHWKYSNLWNSKWQITDLRGTEINFHGGSFSGRVESNISDELLILIGLFIANYYIQMTVILIFIVLLPVWITLISS